MRKKREKTGKVAKLTAVVALSAAIAVTCIPLTGMDVKAEDISAAQGNIQP